METIILVIIVLATSAAGGSGLDWLRRRAEAQRAEASRAADASGAWADLETRRVVVNLKSGQAIDGHLIHRRGTLLFLRAAQLHEPGAEPVPLDGETIIDRAEVDFIQAP